MWRYLLLAWLILGVPAWAAEIRGTLKSATPVTRLVAVDRALADPQKVTQEKPDEAIFPGVIDAKGRFLVTGLLPGKTYDLIVWTGSGKDEVRWEGVDMAYHREVNPADAVTDDDKKWLRDFIEKTPQFYDKCRILRMAADHQHATLLVELMRTREFHSGSGGEVIYRVELWYFENYFGGWAKDKNTEKVLSRWRGQGDRILPNWQYLPQLGGLPAAETDKGEPLTLTLPDAPVKKHGLAGGLQAP